MKHIEQVCYKILAYDKAGAPSSGRSVARDIVKAKDPSACLKRFLKSEVRWQREIAKWIAHAASVRRSIEQRSKPVEDQLTG